MQIQRELKPMDYTESYEGIIPKDSFRISPSQVANFTYKKHEWYRSQVLGETTFEGNTHTYLGTCIHRVAERIIKIGVSDDKEILDYIDNIQDITVDKEYIRSQYVPMKATMLDYLKSNPNIVSSEVTLAKEIMKGYYIVGTFDALEGDDTIIDFKTTETHSPRPQIPTNYKWQLLTYAWLLREVYGKPINKMKLVWITHEDTNRVSEKTGKALKDYPSTFLEVTEEITSDDMEFIDSYLRLIAETVDCAKKNPNLVYLLFADYRLKEDSI